MKLASYFLAGFAGGTSNSPSDYIPVVTVTYVAPDTVTDIDQFSPVDIIEGSY